MYLHKVQVSKCSHTQPNIYSVMFYSSHFKQNWNWKWIKWLCSWENRWPVCSFCLHSHWSSNALQKGIRTTQYITLYVLPRWLSPVKMIHQPLILQPTVLKNKWLQRLFHWKKHCKDSIYHIQDIYKKQLKYCTILDRSFKLKHQFKFKLFKQVIHIYS